MARITSNRLVEDLNGSKRVTNSNAPAVESEMARQVQLGPFRSDNLAIDLTATVLTLAATDASAPAFIRAQRAGRIVGMTYDYNAAISAGGASAASFRVTKNGTAAGVTTTTPSGGGSAVGGVVDQTTEIAFAEGDKLSAAVTTSHTFAPTTCDLCVYLIVRWDA